MLNVIFAPYAKRKFDILKRHDVVVERADVIDAVLRPDKVDRSHKAFVIAEKSIENDHLLRVVYKREEDTNVIVTFYPARRQHEQNR
jgi:hypothetical protein